MKWKQLLYFAGILVLGCAPAAAPFSVDASHPASPDAAEAPLPAPSEALRSPSSPSERDETSYPAGHMHHDAGHMKMGGGMNSHSHEMKQ